MVHFVLEEYYLERKLSPVALAFHDPYSMFIQSLWIMNKWPYVNEWRILKKQALEIWEAVCE